MHDLNQRTTHGEQILFEGKITILNFVVEGRVRKNHYCNFWKFRVNRENRTYATLISVNQRMDVLKKNHFLVPGDPIYLGAWSWHPHFVENSNDIRQSFAQVLPKFAQPIKSFAQVNTTPRNLEIKFWT